MTTARCPICNLTVWTRCEHMLHPNYDMSVLYCVRYLYNHTTEVVKTVWEHNWENPRNEVILSFDGFVEMTMERVERLLLLK